MPSRIPTYRPAHMPQSTKERHRRFKHERTDKERNALYSSRRWRSLRAWFLGRPENSLCVMCKAEGRDEQATRVDHVLDVRDRPDLTYVVSNFQPLCLSHHNAKTGKSVMERRYGG